MTRFLFAGGSTYRRPAVADESAMSICPLDPAVRIAGVLSEVAVTMSPLALTSALRTNVAEAVASSSPPAGASMPTFSHVEVASFQILIALVGMY
jgi:hypothetical protein